MAMYHKEARELKSEFEKEFGKLTQRQLWLLARFAKVVRRSCRQNTAFNNFANAVFGDYAKFEQVTKVDNNTGGTYPGLDIVVKDEE